MENEKNLGVITSAEPDLSDFELPEPITVTVDKDGKQKTEVITEAEFTAPKVKEDVIVESTVMFNPEVDFETLPSGNHVVYANDEETVKEIVEIMTNPTEEQLEDIKTILNLDPQPELEDITTKLPSIKEEKITIEKLDITEEISEVHVEGKSDPINIDDLVNIKLEQELSMEADDYKQNDDRPSRIAKKIDITNLVISERNAIQQNTDIKAALLVGKASFTVAAPKSGYPVSMLPLVHKDAQRILYSTLDPVSQQREMYKIIHEKIYSSGVERIKRDFNYWLKNTAAEDIDTLYYGVYCSTFPDGGNLQVTCSECLETTGYVIPHDNLVSSEDPQIRNLVSDIIRTVNTEEGMKKYSLVGENETYLLEESGIVVEVKTPTLADLLDIMRSVKEEKIKRDRISVTNMLYINKILIPNKTIKGQYSQITDRKTILHIIDNLSLDDAQLVNNIIGDLIENHRLSYKVKDITCAKCGAIIDDQDFSMEEILFTAIFDKYQ